MKCFSKIKQKLSASKFAVWFFLLKPTRLRLRLVGGMLANIIYISWNTVFAVIYSDGLLLAVSLFYTLLALMRYVLFRAQRLDNEALLCRASLSVGALLLPSAVAMGAVMVYTLMRGVKKSYSVLTLIPQSLFLIYCLIAALIRIARHKKQDRISSVCIDVISLTAAFFSVFNLVNYLSCTGVERFDLKVTMIVGLFAVASAFSSAAFLIIKSKKTKF